MPIFTNIFKKSGRNEPKPPKKASGEREERAQQRREAKPSVAGKKKIRSEALQRSSSLKASSAHGAYGVLVRPHISEKSVMQSDKGKYVFEVASGVTAGRVHTAIEKTYGVAVDRVNMVKVQNKKRQFRRRSGTVLRHNKAIVTLKKGHTIEVLPQ